MEPVNKINKYIASQPGAKQQDLETIHHYVLEHFPNTKLWFLDGKNSDGKVVSNPNIGYGQCTLQQSGGKTKEFYRVGLSANQSGISLYFFGIDDKTYLSAQYGKQIGKASVTGYCIKFKSLKDIHFEVLKNAIQSVMNKGLTD